MKMDMKKLVPVQRPKGSRGGEVPWGLVWSGTAPGIRIPATGVIPWQSRQAKDACNLPPLLPHSVSIAFLPYNYWFAIRIPYSYTFA